MTSVASPAATPQTVLAYLSAGHSQKEAASHFGINERTVRKKRDQALLEGARPGGGPTAPLRPRARRVAQPGRAYLQRRAARDDRPRPVYLPTPDAIAGDTTYWRCPATGELMPIIPGTHRKDWEAERRAAHARRQSYVQKSAKIDNRPAPCAETDNAEPALPPAPQADRPAPVSAPRADETQPARSGPAPLRIVVRVPVATEPGGLVGWAIEHPAAWRQALAIAVFVLLVLMWKLGG